MSKSLGNAIGIAEAPSEMFGKVMSIPDSVMPQWYELLSDLDPDALDAVLEALKGPAADPAGAKRALARNIIAQYHHEDAAREAETAFDKIFVRKGEPDEVEIRTLPASTEPVWIVALLHDLALTKSRGEARRLVVQGGVSLDGERVDSADRALAAESGQRYRLKVGKRTFLEVLFE
jgi:tyrosyl-tRNA synthetase